MRIVKGPYLQDAKLKGMTIMWETDVECEGIVSVYEGMLPHVPSETLPVQGAEKRFSGEKSKLHKVVLSGLETGRDYVYTILSEAGEALSSRYPFRTAPTDDTAISFVLTAELGGICDPNNPHARPIIDMIGYEHPDFIQSVGDITCDGTRDEDWATYLFTPFAKLLQSTPFYPCVGNHEVGTNAVPDSEACRYDNFHRYFAFPHYYSYDFGCAHFCVLDTPGLFESIETSTVEKDSYIPVLKRDLMQQEQIRFLQEDLAETDKKWKFVVFHYPPYTSSIFDVRELQPLAEIFEKYGVDIVFNSHAIVYERSHPLRGGKVSPDGVRYVLAGGYGRFDDWFRCKCNGLSAKVSGCRPNYVRVALTPYRLELQAIDCEGKLFDHLAIDKA